jgi:hypothetical protein
MTATELREEFPHVDMMYVRAHHPDAIAAAREYNTRRSEIDPGIPATSEPARRAMASMMAKIDVC